MIPTQIHHLTAQFRILCWLVSCLVFTAHQPLLAYLMLKPVFFFKAILFQVVLLRSARMT